MNELKDIIYNAIKTLSERIEKNSRICSDSPFKLAFYFKYISDEIYLKYPEHFFSRKDIRKQLLALEREGKIEIVSTCIPMYLLPENHKKYFVNKINIIIKFTTKDDKEQICRLFPDSRLIDGKNQLLTPMTFYDFYSFDFKHKELSERVELIKE